MHLRPVARPFRLGSVTPLRALRLRACRGALCIGLGLSASARAAAQQQPPPDSAGSYRLRPILVRGAGSLLALGAPRPIATLAGAELQGARAAVFLEEAVQAVPGVQLQNRYNFAVGERLSVRGFGGRAQFGVRGVRVLVDGIPATLADGQTTLDHLDVATIGRVEALRGPAASLYGNTAGGVLHFETRDPALEPVRPEALTVFGSDGLRQLRATTSGTAGDVGYLISGARTDYDGFRRDSVAGDRSTYGAARRWSGNATVRVPAGNGRIRTTLNWVDLAAENPGSLAREQLDTWKRFAWPANVRLRTGKDVRQAQAGLGWDAPLGVAGGRGEVGVYGLLRSVDNPIPSDVIALDRTAFGARALAELPAQLGGHRLALGGGFELDFQRDDRQNYANTAGQRGALRLDQLERVRALAAFAHIRLELVRNAEASAGLRYDRFRFEAEDRFLDDGTDDSGARSMDALSPSVGLTVQPIERVEVFASVATSFETPSTTELANRPDGAGGFNPELQPQRGTTVEGGVRGRLGTATTLELTAHHTSLRDELVPFEVPDVSGRTFFRNAGRSRHRGFEVALAATPAAFFSARLAYSYLDARFRTYQRGGDVFDDNRIPGMSPHTLDVIARLTHDRWFTEARTVYRDGVPADDANAAEAPPYFLLDWRAGSPAIRVAAFELAPFAGVNNVLDRRYVAAVTVNAFGGRFFEPGPARSFHVGMRAALSSQRAGR
jgi:iron complex outermembrane recepter protein